MSKLSTFLPKAILITTLLSLVYGPVFAQGKVVRVPIEIETELKESIRDQLGLKGISQEEIDKDAKFIAHALDLNNDGVLELIIMEKDHFGCGASGNCVAWIYQETTDGYKLLTEEDDFGGQEIIPQRTMTKGYLDLITSWHWSATETLITTYKWNGRQYKIKSDKHNIDYGLMIFLSNYININSSIFTIASLSNIIKYCSSN